MPGIAAEHLRNSNNWFPCSNPNHFNAELGGMNTIWNHLKLSIFPEHVLQLGLRRMSNDLFLFSSLPLNQSRFNENIIYSDRLTFGIRGGGGAEEYAARFIANKVYLDELINIEITNWTVTGKNLASKIKQAHLKQALGSAIRSYTIEDKEYYFKNQGGYNTLKECLNSQANFMCNFLNLPAIHTDGSSNAPSTLTAPILSWQALVSEEQNDWEQRVPFTFIPQLRGSLVRNDV